MQHEGMLKVRADLCERIDGLKAAISHASARRLCDRASDLRHLAQQYDLGPVTDLAWKLEGRIARGERGPGIADMLSLMREATECGRTDAQASSAWAAAASVRLT